MAKKHKIRADRLLIIFLFFVLICLLVILGVKYLFSNINQQTRDDETTSISENIKISFKQEECEIYAIDEELGFGFLVLPLEFSSNTNSFEYDLSNLVTDQGLKLSDTFSYENKLKTSNHDFASLNTTNIIQSTSNYFTARIFVPYLIDTSSLTITDMKYDNSMVIALNGTKKEIDTLLNSSTEESIVSSEYDFSCTKPYIEDMMKYNDEPYDSSMLSVYVYRLTCNSVKDGVKVVSAIFTDNEGNGYEAYDESYSSSKVDNIIGKDLKAGDRYALFFELYNNEEDPISYQGTIKLFFSDGSSVEVETTLD